MAEAEWDKEVRTQTRRTEFRNSKTLSIAIGKASPFACLLPRKLHLLRGDAPSIRRQANHRIGQIARAELAREVSNQEPGDSKADAAATGETAHG